MPNLLVVADDLFLNLETAPDMFAEKELYSADGYFADSVSKKLGGTGIFSVTCNDVEVSYRMKLYANGNALPGTALPDELLTRFM